MVLGRRALWQSTNPLSATAPESHKKQYFAH
jgi:hypothetical protein